MADHNLDKLWHDTIEKKEANKQLGFPDFRKDAIFSATLNRISIELESRSNYTDDSSDYNIEESDLHYDLMQNEDVYLDQIPYSDLIPPTEITTNEDFIVQPLAKCLWGSSSDTAASITHQNCKVSTETPTSSVVLSDISTSYPKSYTTSSPKRKYINESIFDLSDNFSLQIIGSPTKRRNIEKIEDEKQPDSLVLSDISTSFPLRTSLSSKTIFRKDPEVCELSDTFSLQIISASPSKQQANNTVEVVTLDSCSVKTCASPKRKHTEDLEEDCKGLQLKHAAVKKRRFLDFNSCLSTTATKSTEEPTPLPLTTSIQLSTELTCKGSSGSLQNNNLSDSKNVEHESTSTIVKPTNVLMPVKSMVNGISDLNLSTNVQVDKPWSSVVQSERND